MIIIDYTTISELENIQKIDKIAVNNSERINTIKISIDNNQCLIAKADNKVAGYLVFNKSFYHNNFIDLLIVDQLFRRQGIGTALIRFYENIIKKGKIFTSTNKSNVIMQKLMNKLGYIKSGIVYNLDEGDPEMIYFKKLEGE
ncbi:MAG TPA: GNAT family N-acetyltransferase [Candidatus Lokiarchaeia archaeon]